jgi:hypothetical protein
LNEEKPDMTVEGLQQLDNILATARAEIAAAAPDAATAIEGEAYLARELAANLAGAFLGHLLNDSGFSRALPVKGAPNPDYLLSHAAIDPARRYRLEGKLNDSERIGVGLYTFTPEGIALLAGYAAFDTDSADDSGCFSLDIAADASGPGTLAITPDCRVLLVRTLHHNPQGQPGRVTLKGGPPQGDLPFASGDCASGYQRAGQMTLAGVRQFLIWSELTSANPNRFMTPPPGIAASAQGDPDTSYFLGYYNLKDGEWLAVRMPDKPVGYWSLHAYTHWCEVIPGAGIHNRNAVLDSEQPIHISIGPNLPADAPNPINTFGRHRGVLIFRAIGKDTPALPATEVRR